MKLFRHTFWNTDDHVRAMNPEYIATQSEWLQDVVQCWAEDHAGELQLGSMKEAPVRPWVENLVVTQLWKGSTCSSFVLPAGTPLELNHTVHERLGVVGQPSDWDHYSLYFVIWIFTFLFE